MPSIIDYSDITLIGIDGVGTDQSILKALKYSKQFFPNAKAKFLSSGHHDQIDSNIEHIRIQDLNYDDFSVFCLTKMHEFIDTTHMLYCHGDGFVTNPEKWNPDFLKYDYIGAPWPKNNLAYSCYRWPIVKKAYEESSGRYRIGNGGFSLRTKKLMKEVSSLYKDEYFKIPEDLVVSIILRKELENKEFKFVDDILFAGSFSCEAVNVDGYILSSNNSLGFHCGETHRDKVKLLELL
jgi:hypothetical protein